MKKKHISKGILKIIYCVVVFFVSLTVFGAVMNRENKDTTMTMSDATLPVVSFQIGGIRYNEMYGYLAERDYTRFREGITPLLEDRTLAYKIDTYGTGIKKINVRVRSISDGRLIEDTQIYDYVQSGQIVTGEITVKDLLEQGKNYSLCLVLTLEDGRETNYYTNIQPCEEYPVKEVLEFVKYFHDGTFDKYVSQQELSSYM